MSDYFSNDPLSSALLKDNYAFSMFLDEKFSKNRELSILKFKVDEDFIPPKMALTDKIKNIGKLYVQKKLDGIYQIVDGGYIDDMDLGQYYSLENSYGNEIEESLRSYERFLEQKFASKEPIYYAYELKGNHAYFKPPYGVILQAGNKLYRRLGVMNEGISIFSRYYGLWGSPAMCHVEDLDQAACNLMIDGAPKLWLSISRKYWAAFYDLLCELFPEEFGKCRQFIRHKTIFICPSVLRQRNIPFDATWQFPGDLIVNPPGCTHWVVNGGPCQAVAWNCATKFCVPFMFESTSHAHHCRKTTVSLDMQSVMREYFDIEMASRDLNRRNVAIEENGLWEKEKLPDWYEIDHRIDMFPKFSSPSSSSVSVPQSSNSNIVQSYPSSSSSSIPSNSTCLQCGKTFKYPSGLKVHLESNIHSAPSHFCDCCNPPKSFSTKGSKERHTTNELKKKSQF